MKKLYLVFISCLFCLLCFSACSNFANSKLYLTQLEEAVAYANLPFVDVTIKAQNKDCYENLLPAENLYDGKYKKNDKINLSIITSAGYTLHSWTCIPEGSVSFENAGSESTVATIVADSEPIIITPECSLIPKVTSYYPNLEATIYSKDTVISICFNTKIDESYFSNFSHITITSESEDLNKTNFKKYFLDPEVVKNKNGYELHIKPNTEKITELLRNKESEKLYVTIELTGMKNSNKEAMFSEDLAFSYRINNTVVDTKAPEFIQDFKIFYSKQDAINNTGAVFPSYVSDKNSSYDDYCDMFGNSTNDYKRKYDKSVYIAHKDKLTIGSTVWLSAKIKDTGYNNLQKIVVTEQNMDKYSGIYYKNYAEYVTTYTTYDNNSSIIFNPEDNVYTFLTEYQVKSAQGVVRFVMEVFDGCSETSEQFFDVLHTTNVPKIECFRTSPAIKGNTTTENITLYYYFEYNEPQPYGNKNEFSLALGALTPDEYNNNNRQFRIKTDAILYSYDNINFTKVTSFQNDYITIPTDTNPVYYYPSTKVTIPRDCTKAMYVKLVYSDVIGNKGEVINTIPKNIDVIDASITNGSVSLTFSEKAEKSYLLFYSKDNSAVSTVYRKMGAGGFQNGYNLYFPGENTVTFPLNNLEESTTSGIYKFFVMPVSFEPDKLFTDLTDNASFKTNIFNCINDKFTLDRDRFTNYKTSNNSTLMLLPVNIGAIGSNYAPLYVDTSLPSSSVPSSALPSSFTLTETSNGINSSSYSVKVNYPAGFSKNSNYLYFYEIKNKTDNQISFVSDNPFTCTSGYTYDVKIIVKSKDGSLNNIASDPVATTKTSQKINVPPSWGNDASGELNFDIPLDFNRLIINDIAKAANDNSNISKISYYIDSLDTATINDFDENAFTATLDSSIYTVYYNGLTGGHFHFLVKDDYGNYIIRTLNSSNTEYFFDLSCEYVSDKKIKIVRPSYIQNDYSNLYLKKLEYDNSITSSEHCKWGTEERKNMINQCFELSSPFPVFIKVSANYQEYLKNIEYGYIKYFNPATFAAQKVVNLASVITNGDEYIIMSDRPVFVHTLQSPCELSGEQNWERYGIEVQKQYSEASMTYKPSVSTSNYTKGYYYTTIVHFADGTYKILDVKQK